MSVITKNWIYPKIISHRGGGILAPENTLYAIQTGVNYGYKGVEFDVMLSKDNIPMLMHDPILDRTIRHPIYSSSDTKLYFNQLNAKDLMEIDAGSYYDSNLTNVCIPLFDDVLKYCIENNIWMNIEIKPVPGFEAITGKIVAETTAKYFFNPITMSSNTEQNVTILPILSSFDYESLLEAKKYAPHIPRGYLIESMSDVPDWKERLERLDAISLHTNHLKLTVPEQIKQVKDLGYGLFCYTVNDVSRAKELLNAGVDAFCTDHLQEFRIFLSDDMNKET